jgi:type IV pilus assembly protein PilM
MDFNYKTNAIWKDKDIVGLDIGTHSIKAVQLKKKRKLVKLAGYGMMKVPENYIIEGIITEPEKMAKIIKEFFEKSVWGKINAPRINLSLSESQVFTKIMTIPHSSGKTREDAVMWEATQSVPMSMSDLYVDWQLIGTNKADPKLDDIIFTAAPKSIVNSYLQFVGLLGLEIYGVETSLSAITRAMIPNRGANETVLAVDMGGQTTNLAIFDQFIRVTGSTLVGGNNLTKRIAQVLSVTPDEAEKMKLNTDEKTEKKISEAIAPDLTSVTQEIDRMVRYYTENNKDEKVSKVLLCGGSANLPGLTEYFTEKLNIPTSIGNPWTNISVYPIKPVPKQEASLYTNAIGLALAGIKDA